MTLQMLFYESYITLISDINTRKRLQEKRTIGHWKVKVKVSCSVALDSAIPWTVATRLLCPWNSPGKNTGVGCQSLLQRIFPSQGLSPSLLHCRQILHLLSHTSWSGLPFPSPMHESEKWKWSCSVMSDSATPWTAAYQGPPSMGFSRQEYWSGLPLPSPWATTEAPKD